MIDYKFYVKVFEMMKAYMANPEVRTKGDANDWAGRSGILVRITIPGCHLLKPGDSSSECYSVGLCGLYEACVRELGIQPNEVSPFPTLLSPDMEPVLIAEYPEVVRRSYFGLYSEYWFSRDDGAYEARQRLVELLIEKYSQE